MQAAQASSNQSSKFVGQTLILGPGALGAALAAEELACGEAVVGLGRRSCGLDFALHRAAGSNASGVAADATVRSLHFSVCASVPEALTRLAELNPLAASAEHPLVLLVTLPPQHQAEVGKDVVVQTAIAIGSRPLLVLFGGNGLLPRGFAESLRSRLPRSSAVTLARALFYTGFLREKHEDGLHVYHTGGHRVVCGALEDNPCSSALLTRYVDSRMRSVSPASCADGAAPLFSWERTDDVRAAEWTKFYVNFLLALGTGPALHKNGTLFSRSDAGGLTESSARAWADGFVELAAAEEALVKLTPGALLATLTAVVASTAANINSVSLAAHRGDASTFFAFVDALEMAAKRAHGVESVASTISILASLRSARRAWGEA